ncbi:response regulator [Sulfurimonas aquatica]|uniref:Response regulator n=1 Tax=Sulfurimonas aquatica TaxID=2672570 RepID=A0A975B2N7_9BACT|nr:HD domain-containing phosphohydrolase [Sulfurimonas aquatica]QSZ43008.1 response regulator [Sulfurimonas aquatica]
MTPIVELKKLAQNYTVLYVEDDESVRSSFLHYLESFFKRVAVAFDGKEGLELYKNSRYDLVITDIEMPSMNGIEMATEIKKINDAQDIVVVSAYSRSDYFLESIRIGVSGYIIKPADFKQINETLYKILYKLERFKENEQYKVNLEVLVEEKSKEQSENYEKTILSLVTMIDKRDTYTGGHSQRVAKYSRLMAEDMGYTKKECELIYRAGILHDIGKITTPDAILLKPGKLNNLEYKIIQEHVNMSRTVLEKIPMYESFIEIIIAHHEHYDGSGYPHGLKGDKIPPMARIMIVADAFDAMTTSRIYKARKSIEEAIAEIKSLSGIHFDPEVVKSAVNVLSSVEISNDISQLPKTELEEERFAYFYKDQLTSLYNPNYLNLLLVKNVDTRKFSDLSVLFMHKFANYNETYGWHKGDKLLQAFSDFLKTKFPDKLIFRVHGDDFVVVSDSSCEINIEEFLKAEFFHGTDVTLSSKEFSIVDDEIDSLIKLEDIISRSNSLVLKDK